MRHYYSSDSGGIGWIIVGIIAVITVIAVGCVRINPSPATIDESISQNENSSFESNQFIKIKEIANGTMLVYDKDTKNMYIMTENKSYYSYWIYSFCPYYDKDGNIMKYKG